MKEKSTIMKTRRELFDYLEEQMNKTYRQVLGTKRLESESTFVKTFLLEFDWEQSGKNKRDTNLLVDSLTLPTTSKRKKECKPDISETHEDGFYKVTWNRTKGKIKIYLDTSSDVDRRFWIAYSLSDAAELDVLLDGLSKTQTAFDRVWLWPEYLFKTQEKGEFRGIGLDYDYRQFEKEERKTESTNYFKMQVWGGKETKQILEYIKNEFPKKTVLSKIRMKYWFNENSEDMFALEDIKYNGKFTTRGTSFSNHQTLVSNVRCEYSKKIKEMENNHIIRWDDNDNTVELKGDPIFFNIDEPIENLEAFCKVVFSGSLPFRLWGVPQKINGNDGLMVPTVDLHTGSNLSFEIFNDLICMYLYPGACGNTIARFFTNLQHYYGCIVKAFDIDGNSVF